MSNYIMEQSDYLKIIKDSYIDFIIQQIKNNPIIRDYYSYSNSYLINYISNTGIT